MGRSVDAASCRVYFQDMPCQIDPAKILAVFTSLSFWQLLIQFCNRLLANLPVKYKVTSIFLSQSIVARQLLK